MGSVHPRKSDPEWSNGGQKHLNHCSETAENLRQIRYGCRYPLPSDRRLSHFLNLVISSSLSFLTSWVPLFLSRAAIMEDETSLSSPKRRKPSFFKFLLPDCTDRQLVSWRIQYLHLCLAMLTLLFGEIGVWKCAQNWVWLFIYLFLP